MHCLSTADDKITGGIFMTDDMHVSAGNSSEPQLTLPDTAVPKDPEKYLSEIPDYNDDFTIEMIIQKILKEDKQYDLSKIISAYEFAAKAHEGQKRSSGQDYIIHPLAVAYILLELGMNTDTICAALLHDVVEPRGTAG